MIRVSEPLIGKLEKKYISEALKFGEVSSSGKFVKRFEEAFAKWSGNKYAVACSSGTSALETAIWSLGIKNISVPSGTIISCYTASIRAGAKVELRDNDSNASAFNDVMRCHLFGRIDNSEGVYFDFCDSPKFVDDLSQYWKPFKVQNVGCYSLYANKLITSGEGGVIVTNDKSVYDRAKSYINLCHSEERFIHREIGYNFRMSNIQAAVALAQLERIDEFTEIKQKNRDIYLQNLPSEFKPLFNVEVPWMYLVRSQHNAGEIVKKMFAKGIECRRFFYPLHKQPCFPENKHKFPLAELSWERDFYLPSGLNLTKKEILYVCKALREIL